MLSCKQKASISERKERIMSVSSLSVSSKEKENKPICPSMPPLQPSLYVFSPSMPLNQEKEKEYMLWRGSLAGRHGMAGRLGRQGFGAGSGRHACTAWLRRGVEVWDYFIKA